MKSLLHSLQIAAARSRVFVRLAVYVRNQCNMVIKYSFAEGPEPEDSGERWFLATVAPTADTIMDIGANVGEWTAAARDLAPPTAECVAVEPGRGAFERLLRRFAGASNVRILRTAVSSSAGQAPFYEEPDASETSSLSAEFAVNSSTAEMIDVSTVDMLAKELSWSRVDFLKIDTEGYDLRVLEGAKPLLDTQSIGVIQFEYNDPWRYAGSTLYAALSLLTAARYEVFMLRRDGLYTFNYKRYGEFFGYSNFVAVAPNAREIVTQHVRGSI